MLESNLNDLTDEQLLAMVDLEDLTDDELMLLAESKSASTTRCDLDAEKEVTEVIEGMRKRATEEKARVGAATESEYWCQIVFQSKEQRDAFFEAVGKELLDDQWVDGQKFAASLGVELPPGPRLKSNRTQSWNGFVQ
jgi:hypothetical protein